VFRAKGVSGSLKSRALFAGTREKDAAAGGGSEDVSKTRIE